jgi:hypothetical protein
MCTHTPDHIESFRFANGRRAQDAIPTSHDQGTLQIATARRQGEIGRLRIGAEMMRNFVAQADQQ